MIEADLVRVGERRDGVKAVAGDRDLVERIAAVGHGAVYLDFFEQAVRIDVACVTSFP